MSTGAEVRETADIVRDLLEFAQSQEWEAQINIGCSCHGDYRMGCPSCHALENPAHTTHSDREPRSHEPDCNLARLIREAEAYLEVEDDLARERELAAWERGEATP